MMGNRWLVAAGCFTFLLTGRGGAKSPDKIIYCVSQIDVI